MVKISCVNLTGLRHSQKASWRTLFLELSVTLFLEEINIRITRLNKDGPHQSRWVGSIPSIEGLNRTKRWRKGKLDFSCLHWNIHLLLPLDIGIPGSQIFHSDRDLHHRCNLQARRPGKPVVWFQSQPEDLRARGADVVWASPSWNKSLYILVQISVYILPGLSKNADW